MHGTTAILNSTTSLKTDGFGGFIRPTQAERLAGRLMRAPDHDASTGSGDGADTGDDSAGKATDAEAVKADASTDGGSDAGKSDTGDDAGDADGSILGNADSKAGDGDGGKDGEGDGKSGQDDKGEADGPPETYELKVTTKDAEGKDVDVEIDADLLTEATPVLKELGLSNEQANKLAPFIVKAQERAFAKQNDDFTALKTQWAKDAKADKELGKNWAETETLAAKALDQFGAPKGSDFRKLLDETGLGNHPEMVRMFRRIGEKIGEDMDVSRDPVPAAKKDSAEILYPDDVKQVK